MLGVQSIYSVRDRDGHYWTRNLTHDKLLREQRRTCYANLLKEAYKIIKKKICYSMEDLYFPPTLTAK